MEPESQEITAEFEILDANLDEPVRGGTEIPYPPAAMSDKRRAVYDAALDSVAKARERAATD